MSDVHQQPPADHSVKIPHLVFGLLFLGIAAVWALVVTGVIIEDRLTVIAPAMLIGAGVIGLAASLASTRNRRNDPESPDRAYPDRDDPGHPRPENHQPVDAEATETDEHAQEIR